MFVVGIVIVAGCKQPPPPSPNGPASGSGWEVRYDAVLALAHRGSDKFLDPVVLDLVQEMLDEEQQLRNFRVTLKSGQEVTNAQAARMAILGTISSVRDFHEKKPTADLKPIGPAIDKLTKSQIPVIAKEARALAESLSAK